jgi:hypothetical protein
MRKSTLLWILAICAATTISAGVTAQVLSQPFAEPRVLSGGDLGFRVEGHTTESRINRKTSRTDQVSIVTGRLMVKVNGQWVEAEISGDLRPAIN